MPVTLTSDAGFAEHLFAIDIEQIYLPVILGE